MSSPEKTIVLDGNSLTLEEVIAVARRNVNVAITKDAEVAVKESREIVDKIVAEKKVTYGVNTGFGSLCNVSISPEDTEQLQENLIRTHSAGFGVPFSEEVVRAIMLIRINSLVKGYSGIRLSTVRALLDMLNKGVHPYIPEKGSLGASGDLAPLAHMVMPLLGLGRAYYEGELLSGKEAMDKAELSIIKLNAKEGLAFINGTTVLTAVGALATYDAIELLKLSDIAGALSLEVHSGISSPFEENLHTIRPQSGQLATAQNIRYLMEGSQYTTKATQERVQDPYTLRCIPQIHGASKDSIAYIKEKVEIEINSVTDNPIITRSGEVISGGNFHGEPLAQPFDFLGIAVADIGNVSERRVERLVNTNLSKLPSFLVKHPGLNSGFMITQYSCAALASENKILAHPATVDSIPSCENQEDFVSMGTIAARTATEIVKNSRRIVATEIMAACQALDLSDRQQNLGKGTQRAYDVFRKAVGFIENDKDIQIYDELNKATAILEGEELLNAVERMVHLSIQFE
ncbi:histidine ammonia-lyase [Tetragenococcus koreensis]|uniref:Histidine ammonia-lyase n=1 Tax=Tetragenococcus koreensis TaxID=290335 RepID=A0AAN4ZRC1_9ENTE|nr:histidine ammonia-lyase [Tetragenococcus koreensis]GEQ49641.1 histidine ammonia-lyase [Tetragenococcus koreensis]GEQ52087.1 histidine ammonia-lyase [Tetragenococcus koreensis]GEQ54622.1 histidine ammonia-lyase [Tetragenococcus koreensis]GEQ57098.1 histidine ammonia-lyase [Tetragenococcus koreensis]GEQ59654.1 histidine ammonia-lyase [Tetragenococcus koreensis]